MAEIPGSPFSPPIFQQTPRTFVRHCRYFSGAKKTPSPSSSSLARSLFRSYLLLRARLAFCICCWYSLFCCFIFCMLLHSLCSVFFFFFLLAVSPFFVRFCVLFFIFSFFFGFFWTHVVHYKGRHHRHRFGLLLSLFGCHILRCLLYAFPSSKRRREERRGNAKELGSLEARKCVLNILPFFRAIQGGPFRIPGVSCRCFSVFGAVSVPSNYDNFKTFSVFHSIVPLFHSTVSVFHSSVSSPRIGTCDDHSLCLSVTPPNWRRLIS